MRRTAVLLMMFAIVALGVALIWPERAAAPEPAVAAEPAPTADTPATHPAAATPAPSTPSPATAPGVRIPNPRRIAEAAYGFADGAPPAERHALALRLRDLGQYSVAALLFRDIAEGSSALAPLAALRLAQVLVTAGEDEAAAEAFAGVIASDALHPTLRPVALLEGAGALEAAGRRVEALAALEAMEVIPDASATNLGRARWARAQILREAGEPWTALAIAALTVAPGASFATDALDAVEGEGVDVPAFTAARVNYLARRNAEARAVYEALLEGRAGPLDAGEQATAWFYLGALHERGGRLTQAIEAYGRALDAAPGHALADDARYWRGRVYEELGDPVSAAREYDALLADYPQSAFAADARMRAAVATAFNGATLAALERFEAIASDPASNSADAALAARWHAVFNTRAAAGRTALDATVFHPYSIGAVLERAGLEAVAPLPAAHADERPEPVAWQGPAVAEWISVAFGPQPIAGPALRDHPDLSLATLMAASGETGIARTLFAGLLSAYTSRPHDLADLIPSSAAAGVYDVSLRAAARILNRVPPQARLEAPRALLAAAYPVHFLDEAVAASEEFGLPPLLLYALVRQESAFDPRAGSSAGAQGLTQVIHPTGRGIAAALGRTWDPRDLIEPRTSLRYGAFYLAEQVRLFDGNVLPALAAYNGGPGNAARWLRVQPFPGADAYIHAVEFAETTLYLQIVLENYAMYRYIYAGAEAPSIR